MTSIGIAVTLVLLSAELTSRLFAWKFIRSAYVLERRSLPALIGLAMVVALSFGELTIHADLKLGPCLLWRRALPRWVERSVPAHGRSFWI